MPLTVFAEKMGFFHKGSDGKGIAPLDVCLSPPPGPVPIPYTNVLFAKDLIKGSRTVRIDGEPTFLEDHSETSTSIGDEGGTLGGSVVTGVILGKGYFMVWSMTVQIEGLGVCRHGDMMGQNSASAPPSSIDAAAIAQHSAVQAPVPGPVASRRAARARVMQATGPGDSQEAEVVPCDFEKIAIECKHTGSGDKKRGFGPFEYTFNGQIQDNLPRPAPSRTVGRGRNRRTIPGKPFVPNIQVVAGPDADEADTVKIDISGGPGYGCSKTHPHVTITDRDTGEKQEHHGKTKVELEATCKQLELPAFAYMSPVAVLAYFWFPPQSTRRYILEVESCGVLANKAPGFRKLSRQIDVFPKDTYKFSFSLPAVSERAYTRSRARISQPNAQWAAGEDQGWGQAVRPYAGEHPIRTPITKAGASIKLTRNGEDLKATASLGKIVQAIANIENQIQSVMNFIRDFQPQVGWKFVFTIAFFKGDLGFTWGAKEANSNTIYRWWKLEAELTLLSLELELSFGFDFRVWRFMVTAVVFGKISGEAKLSLAEEAKPDETELSLTIAAEIKGELGITAALGADWVAAEGKLESGFPFEASPKVHEQDGFGIDYKLEFSGIKGQLMGSIKFVGSFSKSVTIMDKKELAKGRFPEGATHGTGVAAP